jgi:hypothetical protein
MATTAGTRKGRLDVTNRTTSAEQAFLTTTNPVRLAAQRKAILDDHA